ncbi:MAG: hypothetical protein RLZZ628_1545 [Bacteroidota bacterium]|jgi:hypothetical protein
MNDEFKLCGTLEFGLNGIFLGLNRIDFLGFLGFKCLDNLK